MYCTCLLLQNRKLSQSRNGVLPSSVRPPSTDGHTEGAVVRRQDATEDYHVLPRADQTTRNPLQTL